AASTSICGFFRRPTVIISTIYNQYSKLQNEIYFTKEIDISSDKTYELRIQKRIVMAMKKDVELGKRSSYL
ncbi:hypothetical protein GIB67_002775, partial [Kingdonia uniflora]